MRWARGIAAAAALAAIMMGACRDWDRYLIDSASGGAGIGGAGGSSAGGAQAGGSSAGGGGGSVLAACGYIDALSDDFEDGIKDDPVWSDDAYDGAAVYETVGAYVVELDADTSDGYFATESAFELTDRTLTIDIAVLSLSGDQSMWFAIGDGVGDDYVEFTASGGSLFFARQVDGNYEYITNSIPLDFPTIHFFRFRESGGTIHYETSSDGITFDEQASTTPSFDMRHTYMDIGAGGDGLGGTGELRIESVEGGPTQGSLCKTESFSDDFDDGAVDPAWEPWQDNLCVHGESNGHLVAQVAANADGDDCGYVSKHAFDFTGSKVSIEVVDLPTTAETWMFVLDPDEENGVGFGIDAGTMYVVSASGGNFVDLTSLPYDNQAHRWLRLSEAAGTVHWEVSPDGQAWSEVHAAPAVVDLSILTVFLGAGASGLQANSLSVELDNFNITN